MKNKIKNSIDEIKISNSQKEEIYNKILYKKNFDFKKLYQVGFVCAAFIFCLMVLEKPNNVNDNIRSISVSNLMYDNFVYEQIDVPYEVGEYLSEVFYEGEYYSVYENLINDKSIILYNEFYEVFVKREG